MPTPSTRPSRGRSRLVGLRPRASDGPSRVLLPQEPNPRSVFYRLFGQGDTDAERKAIVHETGSILDAVSENGTVSERRAAATATASSRCRGHDGHRAADWRLDRDGASGAQ